VCAAEGNGDFNMKTVSTALILILGSLTSVMAEDGRKSVDAPVNTQANRPYMPSISLPSNWGGSPSTTAPPVDRSTGTVTGVPVNPGTTKSK
jgi:hypothetical protein